MKYLKSGFIAAAVMFSASTFAQVGAPFAGVSWGESSGNFNRSSALKANEPGARFDHIIRNSGTWSVRGGMELGDRGRMYLSYDNVSDSYHSQWKTRQENLTASYDARLPIGPTTHLFGGGTLGITKVSLESSGIRRDTDYGYAAGLQAGVLQDLGSNFQIEGGFRYMLHNAKVDVKDRTLGKIGSAELERSKLVYVGLNYRF